MIPVYNFTQRDAANAFASKRFTDLLVSTGRFWRDEKSLVCFKVADGDFVRVERKQMLREILLSGETVKLSGEIDDNAFDIFWLWTTSRKWTFPRLNPERPWNPQRPANTGSGLQQKQAWQK